MVIKSNGGELGGGRSYDLGGSHSGCAANRTRWWPRLDVQLMGGTSSVRFGNFKKSICVFLFGSVSVLINSVFLFTHKISNQTKIF